MAITDTLVGIKEHFMNWHHDYYSSIHSKTNNVTNRAPDNSEPVTSEGVYNYVQDQNTALENNLQTYVRNTCNNMISDAQPTVWPWNNKMTSNNKNDMINTDAGLSFNNNFKIPSNAKDGLITAKERAMLYYCSNWFLFSGKEILNGDGSFFFRRANIMMRVNLGLGLVYFRFSYGDGTNNPENKCPWLVEATKAGTDIYDPRIRAGNDMFDAPGIWKDITPIFTHTIATNDPDISIIIKPYSQGKEGILLRTNTAQTEPVSLMAAGMWYYDNRDFINQLG